MDKKGKGFTLLEVIVSTTILAMVMVELAGLFVSSKKWIIHNRLRSTGGELGRYFLDDLQSMYSRQDTWSSPTNCLASGNCPDRQIGIAQGLDRDYSADYTVTPNQPINGLSKVKVTISWTEPSS